MNTILKCILIIFIVIIALLYICLNVNGLSETLKKHEALDLLRPYSIPFITLNKRLNSAELQQLEYPIIFKPSNYTGQGYGVNLIKDIREATHYLDKAIYPIIIQQYFKGNEVTINYQRNPITQNIDIFVVERYKTNKNQLWNINSDTMNKIYRPEWTTPQLKNKIIEITRVLPDVTICRYDLMYSDLNDFLNGNDINIIEVNFFEGADNRQNYNFPKYKIAYIYIRWLFMRIWYSLLKIITLQGLTLDEFTHNLVKYSSNAASDPGRNSYMFKKSVLNK